MAAPEDVLVSAGNVAEIVCSIRGDPEVSISWWRGDVPLQSSEDRRVVIAITVLENFVTQSMLTVAETTVFDAGTYLCLGSSDIGTIADNATLTVESMSHVAYL